ncbi:MAG: nucleotide sugar dehydrogenase [Chloroflexi bacterium]|nr:nucleotide sugar dehydrogenase [Chloroflexota bacterium]
MRVNITGLGYVGQTLAVTLAEVGFTVYGTDTDSKTLEYLRKGTSHIREPDIEPLIRKHLDKNLFVGTPQETYSSNIDVFVICVSTPYDKNTQKVNSKAVENAAEEIQAHLRSGNLVVMRSTLPIGATHGLVKPILERSTLKAGEDFYLAFAPERTIEGNALLELRTLPQIVGGINEESLHRARALFEKTAPVIVPVSSLEAAEAIKLLDNSYRDVRFAYANEIASYFEKAGLNAFEIIRAANNGYPRNSIPLPSPGVGGACLTKDPYILMSSARAVSAELELIAKAREINERIPRRIVERLKAEEKLDNKRVFVAGFAFKGDPETNDMRESPTVDLVRLLKQENTLIVGYDPCVEEWKIRNLGVSYAADLNGSMANPVDIAIFMTNHKSFRSLDVTQFAQKVKPGGLLFDGWGLFNKEEVEEAGLRYRGVGID